MSRRQGNGDSRHYYDWLDRAEEDLLSAQVLLKDGRCLENCAFHCQQAIEKALKAYLLLRSGQLLDGHSLTWLCKQAMAHDQEFRSWLDECAILNGYYISTRYPTDIPDEITTREAKKAVSLAEQVYGFINQQVEEELEQGEQKSRSAPR